MREIEGKRERKQKELLSNETLEFAIHTPILQSRQAGKNIV